MTKPFVLSVILLVTIAIFSVVWWNVQGIKARRIPIITQDINPPNPSSLPPIPGLPNTKIMVKD